VSFKAERLKAIGPHLGRGYFASPVAYCRRHFPHTAINPNNAEQDGLLHRLSENAGLSSVYPAVPRAYHAGFTGYHRKGTLPTGGVDARAARLLTMTADELNRAQAAFRTTHDPARRRARPTWVSGLTERTPMQPPTLIIPPWADPTAHAKRPCPRSTTPLDTTFVMLAVDARTATNRWRPAAISAPNLGLMYDGGPRMVATLNDCANKFTVGDCS
jgi:hypothetical protein